MHISLDQYGVRMEIEDGMFIIEQSEINEVRKISPYEISSINIHKPISLTSAVLTTASKHQIPFLFYNNIGDIEAWVWSPSYLAIATLRKNQVYFTDSDQGWIYMKEYMFEKFKNQIQLLEYLRNRLSSAREIILQAITSIKAIIDEQFKNHEIGKEQFRGIEGSIARIYWNVLAKSLIKYVSFEGRDKRQPEDYFNASINYGYGILYGVIESSLVMVGLDPYMGILHVDRHARCTLAFDHIEVFRGWVDRMVVDLFMSKELGLTDFEETEEGMRITKEGRKKLITCFFKFMEDRSLLLNKKIKRIDHIHFHSQKLANTIRDYKK